MAQRYENIIIYAARKKHFFNKTNTAQDNSKSYSAPPFVPMPTSDLNRILPCGEKFVILQSENAQ